MLAHAQGRVQLQAGDMGGESQAAGAVGEAAAITLTA
jgi:hypothetical protein